MNTETQNTSITMEIAQTILNQIKYTDRSALMAWGAKGFTAQLESKEFQGGVKFLVNGLKFKGIIRIMLRWVDDYTLTFTSVSGKEIKRFEGIYCDQLVEVIDWIEGR